MKHLGDLEVSTISWGLCVVGVCAVVLYGQLGSLYLSSTPALQIENLFQGSCALSFPLPPAQKSDVKCKSKFSLPDPEASLDWKRPMCCSCSKEAAFNLTSITSKHIEQKLVQKSHASACGEGKCKSCYTGGKGDNSVTQSILSWALMC